MWIDGQIVVEDLGSRNGTWFCGKRISKLTLESGDRVSIGKATLAVVIASPIQPRRDSDTTEIQGTEDFVIKNAKMLDLYQQVKRIASHSSSVLILGETGTGEEHVEKMLHFWGDRTAASRLLYIPIRTLSYKLKIHGLLDTDWTASNDH
jgi:transcriptional regulator of acetoin/glycerol metabolism